MCSVAGIFLLTFVTQAYANAEEPVTSLVDRAVADGARPCDHLDQTTLGKSMAPATGGAHYESGMLYKSTFIPSTQSTHSSSFAWPEQRSSSGTALRARTHTSFAASLDKPRGAAVTARAGVTSPKIQSSARALQAPGPLVLFGSQGSRSPLVNWAMHELGLDFSMGDLSQNPHPFGQIPSLKVGDAELFESGAILAYLQTNFGTETNEKIKAAIISWIVWANASLDPICFLETPEGKVYDTGLKNPKQRRILALDDMFSKQQFIVSNDFTLADVAIASYLLYVPQFFPDVKLGQWPHLVAYMKRCAERPSYGKAFGAKVQGFLVDKLTKEAEGGSDSNMFDFLKR